ncbi:solute carrier family 22 member 3-like [Pomacea canaliculata]|uniref:solute carrier family 22 member 3-like n=1 Tax=Pomacea canaliculata TaxID=400727 RepID=UPI000D73152B|nr:solute carrier family 22 member 3-like [Pomacea canaliculata]
MSLYLNTASLAGNLYINFFLSTFIEGTSCVLMFFLLERLGRKLTTSIFLFITGTSLTARSITVSFKDSNILHILGTVFAMFARFGIGGSTSCLFLYIPELFPTKIRNFALGLSTAGLTFGGMLAPFTTFLAEVGVWLPCAIYGTCCILAVLMLRLLPETKGRELAQTVADIEAWCVAKSPSVQKCKSSEADQEMVAV